ncbi:MAG: ABC transporter permease subunit [Rhodospirillaceae bacterium]|nr:ABC transporter permease subunit [Rhodospirillaceae bacterium]
MGSFLRNAKVRSIAFQVVVLLATVGLVVWLALNTATNLAARGIAGGFDFLSRSARFPLSQNIIPYDTTDSFAWALFVGLGNTIYASAWIIVAATLLGFAVALGRRGRNPLARTVSTTFVEMARNTPLVVQLLFWYALVTLSLPHPRNALEPLPGVYLTNRGLYLPAPSVSDGAIGVEAPVMGRFNFEGGFDLSPEFVAMLAGLVLYSAAFVAEIIRAGIDSVGVGQWEAARAGGLTERQALRLIVMPQALRVIVPPMISQYINIVKNTTLALVVGYPDLASVVATTINQTGQAVEGVAILMAVFLGLSLMASLLLNWYNRRIMEPRR